VVAENGEVVDANDAAEGGPVLLLEMGEDGDLHEGLLH
jgi:hypothetical protein